MTRTVPIIYAPRPGGAALGWGSRLAALGVALGCLAVLGVAAWLRPAPGGLGTHEQLGMQACQFQRRTGIACPTCGMTTAFAHFVRGQWLASCRVQPMGFALAMTAAASVWVAAYMALTGRPAQRLLRLVPARYYVLLACGMAILAWAWKIFLPQAGSGG